jgi:cytochrome c-type biogenesis protein CcmH
MDWRKTESLILLLLTFAIGLGASPARRDIEQQARELETRLIAPCCFTQQVSLHHSAASEEVRVDIRRRLTMGETPEQILHAYVERYGKHVLAEPPAEGFDRVLYVLPPAAMVLTVLLLAAVVRRSTAQSSEQESAGGAVDERYSRDLDDQLRDLD